jgi:hypothetical protein
MGFNSAFKRLSIEGNGGRGTSKLDVVELGNILQPMWVLFCPPLTSADTHRHLQLFAYKQDPVAGHVHKFLS